MAHLPSVDTARRADAHGAATRLVPGDYMEPPERVSNRPGASGRAGDVGEGSVDHVERRNVPVPGAAPPSRTSPASTSGSGGSSRPSPFRRHGGRPTDSASTSGPAACGAPRPSSRHLPRSGGARGAPRGGRGELPASTGRRVRQRGAGARRPAGRRPDPAARGGRGRQPGRPGRLTSGPRRAGLGPSGRDNTARSRRRRRCHPSGRYSHGVCRFRIATPPRRVLGFPGSRSPRRDRGSERGPAAPAHGACARPLRWLARPTLADRAAVGAATAKRTGWSRANGMDAKQVWRAALGELQVSLSPANYETWLRDTALVAVDDQRFRVAVPNGFAKDWLEIALPLADQPDPGPHRGLQRPGRVRGRLASPPRRPRPSPPSPSAWSPPASAARAAAATSTPATPSATSSSAPPTASPTPPACRWRSGPATRTTRSSCTAGWAWARRT